MYFHDKINGHVILAKLSTPVTPYFIVAGFVVSAASRE